MLSRHQHELPSAMARNLHRFSLSLMLKLAEFALEFQCARLNHNRISLLEGSIEFGFWSISHVEWAFENTLDASLAVVALENALQARKPTPGSLIHHSDRGVQYASIAYRQRFAERDITISMSRPGNPFDNAKAESFMKTLKAEKINGKAFIDLNDARRRINSFIADVYNKECLHSALRYRSPLEFEAAFAQNKTR
jgi:transposase InsO family protein